MKATQNTIYADFHNADSQGRLRLNSTGTISDLSRFGIVLQEGLNLTLFDDELSVEGRVAYSTEEHVWVAEIDWDAIHRVSPSTTQTSAA